MPNLRRLQIALLGLISALLATSVGAADSPVRRMDRMWAVGAPVLEPGAKAGVYVWVEDRALQLAAHSGRAKRATYRVRIRGTRPLDLSGLEDFKVIGRRGDTDVVLRARAGKRIPRGKVVCKGDLTISDATLGSRPTRLHVGPLAKRAASSVVIGRF